MLVKYKNLDNDRLTEEKDIFIHQLQKKFSGIGQAFIYCVVDCIQSAIFKENEIGIVTAGRRVEEDVRLTAMNFLSEIKKFSQDPNHYNVNIYLDLNGFYGEDLKFLLRANSEDLEKFADSYNIIIPDINAELINEVVIFIFDAMKNATERALDGETCQTQKERIAEETWNNRYTENENSRSNTLLKPIKSTFFGEKKSVTFKSVPTNHS